MAGLDLAIQPTIRPYANHDPRRAEQFCTSSSASARRTSSVSCALASAPEICMAIPPWTRQWSKIIVALDQNRVRLQRKPTVILAARDLREIAPCREVNCYKHLIYHDKIEGGTRAPKHAPLAATSRTWLTGRDANIFNGLYRVPIGGKIPALNSTCWGSIEEKPCFFSISYQHPVKGARFPILRRINQLLGQLDQK